jgi:hypothetical protein
MKRSLMEITFLSMLYAHPEQAGTAREELVSSKLLARCNPSLFTNLAMGIIPYTNGSHCCTALWVWCSSMPAADHIPTLCWAWY